MAKKKTSVIKVFDSNVVAEEEYYLNNPNLPTVNSGYEYTPEMVKAIKRCKEDIIYFAENFFTITDLSEGKRKHIPLRKHQTKFLESMMNEKRLLLLTCRQSGKCIYNDSKVRVKFKPLGLSFNIKVGTFFKLMKIKNWFKNLFVRK